MTENEYTYLLTVYEHFFTGEGITFTEFVERCGKKLLEEYNNAEL